MLHLNVVKVIFYDLSTIGSFTLIKVFKHRIMKNISKITFVFAFLASTIFILSYCRQDDQILGGDDTTVGGNVLLSQKVTAPPAIDGTVDAIWENSTKLEFEAVVPDPSGDLFRSYVGNVISSITLRSAYDAENIYFLAEWTDPTESLVREPWYFDPVAKKWAHESGAPAFSATGSITRPAFYEDKIAMLWNIDNSVSGWNNGTCFKSCHTGMGQADGYARHRTNSPFERIDMWHWKAVRGGQNFGQFDDQYQDNTYPNGRKSDAGTGGYSNNTQKLVVSGSMPEVTVDVPKYVIPNRTRYNWILGSEISDGTAKKVTAVDENGILTLDDGTTIDPNTDVAYQRDGTGVGAKAIPYIYMSAFEGSRGDITCKAVHNGTGWILEYKRALKTADSEKKDIDFSSLEDQNFGFAIFENAQIAHAIKANLLLKFQK
ncbi:MAG: hypothetical protein DYG98_01680 [Haliscomenobacteraceae bacterium CHB4]|nr:hypothetical protein [Haliscomenobacteraceae bacterium CHB4]